MKNNTIVSVSVRRIMHFTTWMEEGRRKDYEPREEVHWLDTLIKAQADHYGLTVEQHARLMRDVADYLQQHPEL